MTEEALKNYLKEIDEIGMKCWKLHQISAQYKNWSDMLYIDQVLKSCSDLLCEAASIANDNQPF